MRVEKFTGHLDTGETFEFNFSEYGWQQWGAVEETLGVTMQIPEALEQVAAEDPALAALLGIRDEDEEEEA